MNILEFHMVKHSSMNFFGVNLPVGAVYGKYNKHTYFYVESKTNTQIVVRCLYPGRLQFEKEIWAITPKDQRITELVQFINNGGKNPESIPETKEQSPSPSQTKPKPDKETRHKQAKLRHRSESCQYHQNGKCISLSKECKPDTVECYRTYRKKSQYQNKIQSKTVSRGISKTWVQPTTVKTIIDYPKNRPPVYVFGGYLTIKKEHLRDCKINTKDLTTNQRCSVFVIQDTTNKYFYMADEQQWQLNKNGIFPDLNYHYASSNTCTRPLNTGTFHDKSKLALYGYKVGKTNGLPKKKRQRIIKYVIDNKIMRGFDIISLLQGHIAMRRNRPDADFTQSIADWADDIAFTQEYLVETKVMIGTI